MSYELDLDGNCRKKAGANLLSGVRYSDNVTQKMEARQK